MAPSAGSSYPLGAAGGWGGYGAPGGAGAYGGAGALGAGGGGGMMMINGAVVQTAGIMVDVAGGTGSQTGGDGRLVVASNSAIDLRSSLVSGARVETYAGRRDINPFIQGNPATPFIPDLQGGAEAYGLLDGLTSTSAAIAPFLAGTPLGAAAGVLRLPDGPWGYADIVPGFDMLLFVNLSDQALLHPLLGIVPVGSEPAFFTPLLLRGSARNPDFGGGGAVTLDALAAHAIYALMIPEDGTEFNVGFNGQGVSALHIGLGAPVFLDKAAQPVPEPATLATLLSGLGLVVAVVRRRRPCASRGTTMRA
jgi:hypothetical protein